MSHLTPEQFVDLVEDALAESDMSHLSDCAECRARLAELRATWALAADAEVPEPSPWFWEQLSSRVRDAVAVEPSGGSVWLRPWSWRAAGLAVAAAIAALGVAVFLRAPAAVPSGIDAALGPAPSTVTAAPEADDPSFGFVADLAVDLDWESASEAGLEPNRGVEDVVADMTDAERAELRRLLTEALDRLS